MAWQEKHRHAPLLGRDYFCDTMIGTADIEESRSNVAMNAGLPQASFPCGGASFPCGNFSEPLA